MMIRLQLQQETNGLPIASYPAHFIDNKMENGVRYSVYDLYFLWDEDNKLICKSAQIVLTDAEQKERINIVPTVSMEEASRYWPILGDYRNSITGIGMNDVCYGHIIGNEVYTNSRRFLLS